MRNIVITALLVLGLATMAFAAKPTVKNFISPSVTKVAQSPDVAGADDNFLTWDGNGNVEASFKFSPTTTLSGTQTMKIRVRKSHAGGNNPNFHCLIEEDGFQKGSLLLQKVGYSDSNWATFTMTWDASIVTDKSGKSLSLRLIQVDGGNGKPAERRGVEISAVEWLVNSTASTLPTSL